MSNLQTEARKQTKDWICKANELYGMNIKTSIPVSFNVRGRSAGQFREARRGNSDQIRYNAILLQENEQNFLDRTVPHEVAHYVVFKKFSYRSKPHGWQWRGVMKDFGLNCSRCHSYDTTNSRMHSRSGSRSHYKYACSCGTHHIGALKHRNIQVYNKVYKCRRCKEAIEYKGEDTALVYRKPRNIFDY